MPKMNLVSRESPNLKSKTASQLSPEEQKFLAEETTNRQVVQDASISRRYGGDREGQGCRMGRDSGTVAGKCRECTLGREARGRGESSGIG